MGLFDFLSKRGSKKVEPEFTAVDYVQWLLEYMLHTSRTELTLASDRALPGSELTGAEAPPCLPEAQNVLNRLRVLAKVSPIRQTGVVEGTFEQPRQQLMLVARVRFRDGIEHSTCDLRIQLKNR